MGLYKKDKKNYIVIILVGIIVALGSGYIGANILFNKFGDSSINNKEQTELQEDKKEEVVKSAEDILNEEVEKILSSMSLNEKVGQLFIVDLNTLNENNSNTVEYSENMINTLNSYNIGGVILFADNIVSREQVMNLNNNLQKNSKTPLFISVDEEGGTVSRIGSNPAMGTTKFGNMRAIGDSNDESKAYEVGKTIGKEIGELGFNLDFAPDADVVTNPNNTEIGSRSFGTNAEVVAKMSSEVVKGLQENNVSATMKHFPGHGGSEANSHNQYSYTPQTLEGMRKIEFIPFESGIKEDVDFILISHIAAPNVTGNNTPSSLNPIIVTDLLRKELGFESIVITDALNMKAVTNYYPDNEACVLALNAGVDMLLMPPNIQTAYNSVVSACNNGDITEERINESLRRILRVKLKRGIIDSINNQ